MNGFSKINVLLGENNSGKTSVLESVFLLSGMSNPQLTLNINFMRGLSSASKSVLKYIFHNLETQNKPLISGNFSQDIKRKVEISPILEKNVVSERFEMSTQDNSRSTTSLTFTPEISGLEYFFEVKR
jgi:AAA15 family ATPase/GTPase